MHIWYLETATPYNAISPNAMLGWTNPHIQKSTKPNHARFVFGTAKLVTSFGFLHNKMTLPPTGEATRRTVPEKLNSVGLCDQHVIADFLRRTFLWECR